MFWYLLNKLFPSLRSKLRKARKQELQTDRYKAAARLLARKGSRRR